MVNYEMLRPALTRACPTSFLAEHRALHWMHVFSPKGADYPALRDQATEGLKKSKQLTQSRKGVKKGKVEVLSLLCDLCVLCAFA